MLANKVNSLDFKTIFSNLFTDWHLYAVLALVFLFALLTVIIFKPKFKLEFKPTMKITFSAMLVAIGVIANAFTFGGNLWKVSFAPLVCFIAGTTLGPIWGLGIGLSADLIAGVIAPQGVYNPIIAIASGLWGFIPGVFFAYSRKRVLLKTILSFFTGYLICSVFLNTTATYLMYLRGSSKYPTLISYVLYRALPTFLTTFVLNTAMAIPLYKLLEKVTAKYMKN